MANRGPLGLLDLATADWETARRLVVAGLYHNACYHAQQAAEKGLKAVLMQQGATFPKTHDVIRLVDAIRVTQPTFPAFALESAVLNTYAVDMRYEPGALTDVDEEEANAAIGYAETILDAVARFWERPSTTP